MLASPLEAMGINLTSLDEILVISFIPVILASTRIDRDLFGLLLLVVVFCIYVIASSVFSDYFRGWKLSLLDLFLFLKPVILAVGMLKVSDRVRGKIQVYLYFTGFAFISLALIFYPFNLILEIFPSFDTRLGLGSYSFVFSNPGEFLNVLIVLGVAIYAYPGGVGRQLVLVAVVLLALSTLRFKGFVMIVFSLMVVLIIQRSKVLGIGYFARQKINLKEVFSLRRILFVGLVSLVPGWYQFESYFLSEMTPRLFLVVNGVALGLENFPFGIGAGTFGSAVSKMYYSPVYVDLGFDKLHGLSSHETNFLSDNFWPMVLAQYGFFGLVLTVVIYAVLFRSFLRRLHADKFKICGFLIVFASLLLSTLGSAILIGALGCLYIMLIASLTRSLP